MSASCSIEKCSFNVFQDDKCILHCCKKDMSSSNHPYFTEPENFYNHLIAYIAKNLSMRIDKESVVTETNIKKYLHNDKTEYDQAIAKALKDKVVVFNQIIFPNYDDRDLFQYISLLKKLGKIHFNYCQFYASVLEMEDIECFFQDCTFYEYWSLSNYKLLKNINDVMYQQCIFNESVNCSGSKNEKKILDQSQFNGCTFKNDLSFENVKVEKQLFNNWNGFKGEITNLSLIDCILEDKWILNNHKIDSFSLKDSIFKAKFEFKENIVNCFEINNCNFEKLYDCYDTKFEEFTFFKSICSDYTGFEKCSFAMKNKLNTANFQYVTFMGFVNFRNTIFAGGLNLDSTNLKEAPNFLNTIINPENTSRETFRILKFSFEKIGNSIESNKYFALEMKKYSEELKNKKGFYQEKLIYWMNDKISNFGQNYIRPLGWLILSSIIYSLAWCLCDCNIISNNQFTEVVNGYAHSFLPFSKLLPKNCEFITLLFMVIQSTLIWHFVVAVKNHTKR